MFFIIFYDKFIKEHIIYNAENKSKLDKLIGELAYTQKGFSDKYKINKYGYIVCLRS